jgi:hypothetical protein
MRDFFCHGARRRASITLGKKVVRILFLENKPKKPIHGLTFICHRELLAVVELVFSILDTQQAFAFALHALKLSINVFHEN